MIILSIGSHKGTKKANFYFARKFAAAYLILCHTVRICERKVCTQVRFCEQRRTMKTPKELKAWEKEKKLIPVMIRKYCHGNQGTKGEALCEECRALTEYALFRLEKCPFKVNKKFCSFCKIHCYKPDMRERIKIVMKWAGPRMIFTHPIFAFKHVFQMIGYKRKRKKQEKAKANV